MIRGATILSTKNCISLKLTFLTKQIFPPSQIIFGGKQKINVCKRVGYFGCSLWAWSFLSSAMMLHVIQVCLIDKSVYLLVGKQSANSKSHNNGKKGITRHNKGLTLNRALALISQRFFIMISSLKSWTNPSCFQQCAINVKQKDMVSSCRICTKSRGIHLHCRSTVLVSIHVQWFPCADGFFLHNMHKLQLEV